MKTLSLDLRQRILDSYDQEDATRTQIAKRFRVSLGMVKKLIQQRRHTGDIGSLHHRCGRKPLIVESHRKQMSKLLGSKPDMTLKELREALGLECSLPAIHYVLHSMGLTYKKRLSEPASRIGRISSKPVRRG